MFHSVLATIVIYVLINVLLNYNNIIIIVVIFQLLRNFIKSVFPSFDNYFPQNYYLAKCVSQQNLMPLMYVPVE